MALRQADCRIPQPMIMNTMERMRIAVPVLPGSNVKNYLDALSALGAAGEVVRTAEAAEGCAGLLLPGGGDSDPALYGQENVACQGVDRALDDLQLAALNAFVRAEKPVLGICRGHQLINIYFGGTLIQHLPASRLHSRDKGVDEDKVHMTRAVPGGFLHALYGESFAVNSSHHQAVDVLGKGLTAVQWSSDGVIEGLAHERLPILAVQWHPERMCFAHARGDTVDGARVIGMFLEDCKRRL